MTKRTRLTTVDTIRYLTFIILGVVMLVFKSRYSGPIEEIIHSFAGNFFVSAAVYFLARIGLSQAGQGIFSAAMAAILATELFEITDGFGVMSNTFDPVDLLVNPAGVAAAVLIDRITTPSDRF
ncbi:MAG TPA: hypothetical protein PK747_07485 [Acidobacteriota bacterium]|nr:hypothetical protein [Acidobacteriota bacterium]HQO18851.1 hypothetical protein [Acidobacteriota bacterium]HQQ47236.1 hypothetical protein [Acidobacteriota bacterium]